MAAHVCPQTRTVGLSAITIIGIVPKIINYMSPFEDRWRQEDKDKLYRKLKQTAPTEFSILSVNLSVYQKILNKTIRNAKRSYYASLFEKSKTSAKDTWAAIKIIMNSNSTQTKFPK